MYKDATLLITGGTGSFGSAVLHKIIALDFKEIRIFSRDEKKQEDMRIRLDDGTVKFHIGDVRDLQSVREVMDGVDYVFHAAALKQVPSCEFYPMEAVRTNVLGAENVLQAARECRVRRVVVLSTDKAVYPINAMGMSKALMEKLMIAKARKFGDQHTIFCATRYGNVMASRGSVIPLFVDQILGGKPITITDAEMTRFLMSLEESVDLVLHAFENAKPGDIFVQKSPACTVGVLAEALIDLFDVNAETRIIGTRHGEKMYETLLSREEVAKAEETDLYFRVPMDVRDLNYAKYFTEGEQTFSEAHDYNSHNTRRLNVEEVKNVLLSLPFIQDALGA